MTYNMTPSTRKGKTMAQQAKGNPLLEKVVIETYMKDLETASPQYTKFITHELDSLGYDRDYLPEDSGNDHTNYYGVKE